MSDAERATALATVLDATAALKPDKRKAKLIGVIGALTTMAPAAATPILERAAGATAGMSAQDATAVACEAILVAGIVGDRDLAAKLVERLVAPIAETEDIDLAIAAVVRGLVRLHMTTELAAVLPRLERDAAPNDAALAAVAGGWFAVGDPEHAKRLLAGVNTRLGTVTRVASVRGQIARALGFAYSNTSIDIAEPGLAAAIAQYAITTDSYSTNSHYCISVLQLVDALVIGIAG